MAAVPSAGIKRKLEDAGLGSGSGSGGSSGSTSDDEIATSDSGDSCDSGSSGSTGREEFGGFGQDSEGFLGVFAFWGILLGF